MLKEQRELTQLFSAVMAAVDASGVPMRVAAQALETAMPEVEDCRVADALSWAPDVPRDSRAFVKAMARG